MPIDLIRFKKEAEASRNEYVQFMEGWNEGGEEEGLKNKIAVADVEVWKEIDCLECANCCKTMTPVYTEEDIFRIASHLGLTSDQYKKRYLLQYTNGDWANLSIPCHFLLPDNKCSIYAIRPACCAGFPHHHTLPIDALKKKLERSLNHCPASNALVRRLKDN